MRRLHRSTLFLGGLLAACLLLLVALRILRWLRPESSEVFTQEIRDMVATLQGSLETMPGIPSKVVAPLAFPGTWIGAVLLAGAAIWCALQWHARRAQQRSRNNLS